MYNKLFTKILDSSIWLEPTPTRVVWVTLIAAMDRDHFAQFASIGNLAHRAIVSIEEASEAVKTLESPDPNSADKEFDGRRIERVPGGWLILNGQKYADIVTREEARRQTRERVARHRAKDKALQPVTEPLRNENVTQRRHRQRERNKEKDADANSDLSAVGGESQNSNTAQSNEPEMTEELRQANHKKFAAELRQWQAEQKDKSNPESFSGP
jgi:hypothetical protein